MSRTIQLSQNKSTVVDDSDYDYLMQWRWYAQRCPIKVGDLWYVWRSGKRVNGRQQRFAMHRVIALRAGLPWSSRYDHRDGDGLNNRRSNLRPCTGAQNRYNSRKRTDCTSRFKGVIWECAAGKWRARIRVDGTLLHLGLFTTQEAAHAAYVSAAQRYFGEFARA